MILQSIPVHSVLITFLQNFVSVNMSYQATNLIFSAYVQLFFLTRDAIILHPILYDISLFNMRCAKQRSWEELVA